MLINSVDGSVMCDGVIGGLVGLCIFDFRPFNILRIVLCHIGKDLFHSKDYIDWK